MNELQFQKVITFCFFIIAIISLYLVHLVQVDEARMCEQFCEKLGMEEYRWKVGNCQCLEKSSSFPFWKIQPTNSSNSSKHGLNLNITS